MSRQLVGTLPRIELETLPNPPVEDRFEIHGTVFAPAVVRSLRTQAGREAVLGTGKQDAAGVYRHALRVVSYMSDPGFPAVRLAVGTEAGDCELTTTCPVADAVPFRPILGSALRLPHRVCIVASGPTAAETHRHIPGDCFVLALNKAVLLPGLHVDAWMMNQLTSDSLAYYDIASRAFPTGPRIFRFATAVATRQEHAGRTDCYWFLPRQAPEEQLAEHADLPIGNWIRGGGTVTGCALQLACALGVRDVLLCGVDMVGAGYFDGTRNDRDPKEGRWAHVGKLNRLIEILSRDHGMSITSLGETAIQVRRWQ